MDDKTKSTRQPEGQLLQRDGGLTGSGALEAVALAATTGVATGVAAQVTNKFLNRPPKNEPPPTKIELPPSAKRK